MQTINITNRYLVDFDLTAIESIRKDTLVIGSGIAGLSAALKAAEFGTVAVVTKAPRQESNTYYAQGGIAAVLNPEDSEDSHVQDTVESGKGLCDDDVVRMVVHEGIERVQELVEWGTKFDRDDNGQLAFTAEGGHSANRILHCFGDHTGKELERTLLHKCDENDNIVFYENVYVIDLLTDNDRCVGAICRGTDDALVAYFARGVILAAGGGGHLFRETTNPNITTGDGFAMAFRAGCTLRDMEFVQFHPTTIYIAGGERTLITEAARGEGALLRNKAGHRFMPEYHDRAELAPRDVVSASIMKEMKKNRDVCVYLDMTHFKPGRVKSRFPNIQAVCDSFGLDPTKDVLPVRPSVHYLIGGVAIDDGGRSGVAGLYAAGEVTSSGLHGANRLGSNSLLEGLVFGHRAACSLHADMSMDSIPTPTFFYKAKRRPLPHLDERDLINSIKSEMWRNVGIERNEGLLQAAVNDLEFWRAYALASRFADARGWTLQNMLTVSSVIATAALHRQETRGAHIRLDYPDRDEETWRIHSELQRML